MLEIIAETNPQFSIAFDMEESRQSGIRQICMRRYCDCVLQEDSCSRIHTHAVYESKLVTQLHRYGKIDGEGIDVWVAQYNTQCDYTGNCIAPEAE